MSDIDALLERNDGLLFARDHRRLKSSLSRWVRQGRLIRVLRGVYAHPDIPMSERMRAVTTRMPGAVIADESALAQHFQPEKAPSAIKVCTPTRRRPQAGFQFIHRVIAREHVDNGLMHARLAAVDVCDQDPSWLDELARLGKATTQDYQDLLAEFSHRRGNQTRAKRVARTSTNPWAMSERVCHDLFDLHKVKGWVANRQIIVNDKIYFADVLLKQERLILEIDGYEYHSSSAAFHADRHRDAELMRAGWMVLHVTWDMLHDPDWLLATLADVRAIRRLSMRRLRARS